MVGTFYRSPSPDSDPFVGSGDSVDEESVVRTTAMKVERDPRRRREIELLAENGEPVELDSRLPIRPR